jgi:sn-1 stearoyl-lipid 9-desaturase
VATPVDFATQRIDDPYRINGLIFDETSNPSLGVVKWDALRSVWNGGMLLAALILGPLYFTWEALAVFLALCFVTLCCGHSVGFHRRLIHRSYQCPKWLERILIYLGTVVGMGGPLWTVRTHDMRLGTAQSRLSPILRPQERPASGRLVVSPL